MKNLLLLAFIVISSITYAQNDLPEREPFTLKLAVDQEQFYEVAIDKTPYFILDNVLQIYPGEKLLVEAEVKSDSIISMKVVKEMKFPEKTIIIDFKQIIKEGGREHEQMFLEVKNPFEKYLNYSAMMYIVGHDEWIDTSIIPIFPKILGLEMWSDVIITITLHSWRIQTEP